MSHEDRPTRRSPTTSGPPLRRHGDPVAAAPAHHPDGLIQVADEALYRAGAEGGLA